MATIPARQPFHDSFDGLCLRAGDFAFAAAQPVEGCVVSASGALTVRYGARFLGKQWRSIVPGLLAIDYGTFLTAEAAWEFLYERSNRYPRAEVFGWRETGAEDQAFIRQLDLALAPQVLLYADAVEMRPIAPVEAWLGPAGAMPDRMRAALPVYATLADWQAAENS